MKKNIITFLAIAVLGVFSVQGANALSLKLKKEQANSQKIIDENLAAVEKSCGCKPAIEVNWESFSKKDDFFIVSRAMSKIKDDMGETCKQFKKEVCAGVKTVKIGKGKPWSANLKNGTMELTTPDYMNTFDVKKLLENNL